MRNLLWRFSVVAVALITGLAITPASGASKVKRVERNEVTAVAYSPDGSRMALAASDGSVFLYSTATSAILRTLTGHVGAEVTAVAFDSSGKRVVTAGRDSTVRVWNARTGELLHTLNGQEQAVLSVAFLGNGSRIVAGGEDARVLVWDVTSGRLVKVLGGNSDFVTAVAAASDGSAFATATRDGRITIRESRSFKDKGTLLGHSDSVTSLAFSPSGSQLASGSADHSVRTWSLRTKTQEDSWQASSRAVTSVAYSPDGGSIATGSADGALRVWDSRTGRERGSYSDASGPVTSVAYSPDGHSILEGRTNGSAHERSAATGRVTESVTVPDPVSVESAAPATTPATPSTTSRSVARGLSGGGTVETTAAALSAATATGQVSEGPGGPVLLITSADDPYSSYYSEILRAEGLNEFDALDSSSVTAAVLDAHDVAVLADTTLSSDQVSMYSDWVNRGGNLVAMKPDQALAGLLGLSPNGAALTNAYLKVDTSTRAGNGIVGESIQFHGTADRYRATGATSIATLFSDSATATDSTAVSLRSVGTQGGSAAAFAFDLARSVVLTRQGNPAWSGDERDGVSPKRSDDLFFGAKVTDAQPDWIDLAKVHIPQADEQQRLLVNLVLQMNEDVKPLPRFWYLPRGLKAAVIMTGDDHGNNGTAGRFDSLLDASPAGCSVEDWECIRGTSYIYPSTPLSSAQATAYVSQGFEIGVHVSTNCSDWTPTSLAEDYASQMQQFAAKYTGVPAPVSNRTHCIAWSDWSTQAAVEKANGIRLDTNYYYWPPSWVADRPGFFTGSGLPMRFTDSSGGIIDVYQAATQLTDESGQSYPNTVDTLLDRALGAEGYYGAFTVNAHTDVAQITESTTTVAAAQARGVPVITAKQMLDWVDARNASSFKSLDWRNGSLTFTVEPGPGARNLDMLIPARSGSWSLSSITRDGASAGSSTRTVKGSDYALVRASAGAYVATYTQDTTAPTVSDLSPADGATKVGSSTAVTATFSEQIDPATVSSTTFELRDSANELVPATVSFDPASASARLRPSASLPPGSRFRATIKGGDSDPTLRDVAGNALATSVSWEFTTATGPNCPCTIWPESATPTNKVAQDPNAVELGTKFTADTDGFVTGIRFWKGSQNTGTHVGSLWTASGQRLANATFSGETSSGWQEVTFASPVAITANTTYVASYHTTSGYYAGDNDFFTSAVDRPPLHALNSGMSGNGVYSYSAEPAFPTSTWKASNYWVDVAFTTTMGPDTTAPSVTQTSPENLATGVGTNSPVTATFSEPLDPASVTKETATVTGPGGSIVPSSVTYESQARTVVIQPDSLLAPSTNYTVTLKGGTTEPRMKDVAGNPLGSTQTWAFTTAAQGPCDTPANAIVAENCRVGASPGEWDVSGIGDPTIQGFATDISVNQGGTVRFKVDTSASSYRIDIYRLGYYGGRGARKVGTIAANAITATNQPACLTQSATGLIDCGNWSESASWAVPGDATSGVYIARPVRIDTGGASHIPFIVRSDSSTSDVVFQTSDTTWQAYNDYGGNSLYTGAPAGRAYKVSYNRPFWTRGVDNGQDWVFNSEFPMIRWLERNGYDVSYVTGVDSDRRGSIIRNHKTFISVGHDEYWSGSQRSNVEAARDAGVNLAFFSGNEIYWKTRWEPSIDGSSTAHRTLVCYKETHANAKIDPEAAWTGTWRDPRFSPPADGGKPENALSGTLFMVNDGATTSIEVPEGDGKMRFWRNTSVARLGAGEKATLPDGTLGYEWDADVDNPSRPSGLVRLSTTTKANNSILQDYGTTFGSGTVTHALSLYRAASGGLVFGAGTVQWAWGLDATHDRAGTPTSTDMQQATVNLLADMRAQPSTLASGLTPADASTDSASPTAVITSPPDSGRVDPNSTVVVSGTASDVGGGRVGAVEVSTDGGTTWHPASGRTSWSYTWTSPASGTLTLKARAADDSGNLQSTPASTSITVSVAPPAAPTGLTATGSASGVNLDWSDTNGATGYNVYRSSSADGTFTKLTASPLTTSSYGDGGAPSGTSYYRVTAVNSGGESGPSSVASATVTAPPQAPSGLAATATSTGITLDWADTTSATGYTVYRATSASGPFTKVNSAPVSTSAWDDTLAPSGISYYQVTAAGPGGESARSSTANASMAKANKLANPSFELDANGDNRPDSWTSSARFLRTAAAARSGSNGATHSGNNANYTIGQTLTGMAAGTSYTFAGWANVPSTTDSFSLAIQIQWQRSTGASIGTQTVATLNASTNGWVKATGTFTAPTGASRAVVSMVATSLTGPVHVDDFSLR